MCQHLPYRYARPRDAEDPDADAHHPQTEWRSQVHVRSYPVQRLSVPDQQHSTNNHKHTGDYLAHPAPPSETEELPPVPADQQVRLVEGAMGFVWNT